MKTFFYQGEDNAQVPQDVEKLVVDPTVEIIPDRLCKQLIHLRQVELSEGLREIGIEAFKGCASLERVSVPSTVETVKKYAFQDCTGERFEVVFTEGSLTTIGKYCFDGCIHLPWIEIPSTVEVIESHTFCNCYALSDVTLRNGLKIIEQDAFADTGLVTVSIPSTTEIIGVFAFSYCTSLVQVNLSQVKELHAWAFLECDKLTRIKVPSTVIDMDCGVFQRNPELITIEFLSTVALGEEVFSYCPKLLNVKLQQPIEYCDNGTPENLMVGCTLLEAQFTTGDIPDRTSQRLDEFKVHQLCYYSSLTTQEELRQQIEQEVEQCSFITYAVDSFGMTPFHLLFSASTPRSDLLRVLLETYPLSILGWKDIHGKRATDYIGYNWSTEWQELVHLAFNEWIVDGLSRWVGEAWVTEIMCKIGQLNSTNDKADRDHLLTWLCDTMVEHERNETMSLLEMAIWKQYHALQNDAEPVDRSVSLALCMACDASNNIGSFLGLKRKLSR